MTNVNSPARHITTDVYQHHPGGIMYRCVQMKCLADRLPWIPSQIVTNGKTAAAAFLGFHIVLFLVWLPFYFLSFLLTEWGVYITATCSIFLAGRAIIRLIAFPGASKKVTTDIEAEFAKYSVRMMDAATDSIFDLAAAFDQPQQQKKISQLPSIWRRVKGYRDRVLGVYCDVLVYMKEQDSTGQLVLSTVLPTARQISAYGPELSRYGNNLISGDIGCFRGLTTKAQMDGNELLNRLQRVLALLDDLELNAKSLLEGTSGTNVSDGSMSTIGQLKVATRDLKDFASSLRLPLDELDDGNGQNEDPTDNIRRNLENGPLESAKSAVKSVLPMLDPSPHTSIYGFDVLRGCVISRYRGARQLWVRRPTGGMIDVLHFPAPSFHPESHNNGQSSGVPTRNPVAMLYCNPNAGLIEVAAGMSFSGGNVPTADTNNSHDDSWIDYYTELGIDVYVFNYAGYGRSFGTNSCVREGPSNGDHIPGVLARIARIVKSSFFAFKPTPDTLRADGIAVAQHLFAEGGVQELTIHGESIGGMAAAGIARYISQSSFQSKLSVLVCDRAFCNLEAIAQRLVGGWSGYAIRALTPFWNTDVAGDYLATTCPKILASDAADVIISEASSLKSGVALWKELRRGIATTKGIGWIPETPLQYRMADFENCCVNESRYVAGNSLFRAQPPLWRNDKHVSVEEAFHFAACCKRIGKVAKQASQAFQQSKSDPLADSSALDEPLILRAWITLGCCDGLTGATLGVVVKSGFDATVTWLCSCLVFGGQHVAMQAEKRTAHVASGPLEIASIDFDTRPEGFREHEMNKSILFPKPIPGVMEELVQYLEAGDADIAKLAHEFQYIIGMLQYIQARLSDPTTIHTSLRSRNLEGFDGTSVGSFLNLHCGHNNPFSKDERQSLKLLLKRAVNSQKDIV